MKKIGLIGGTSWLSTIEYYRYINQKVNDIYGNNTNPPLILYNLNQHEIHELQRQDRWQNIAELYINASFELKKSGVEYIAFCANTPHKVYNFVNEMIDVPIIHIGDSIGKILQKRSISSAGLLGTKFTMKDDFIINRIKNLYSIDIKIPNDEEIENIQSNIYNKLSINIYNDVCKNYLVQVINRLIECGVESIILGCTEFPILLKDVDIDVEMINSTTAHCDEIIEILLN